MIYNTYVGSPDSDGGSLSNIHSLALALEQHVRLFSNTFGLNKANICSILLCFETNFFRIFGGLCSL